MHNIYPCPGLKQRINQIFSKFANKNGSYDKSSLDKVLGGLLDGRDQNVRTLGLALLLGRRLGGHQGCYLINSFI